MTIDEVVADAARKLDAIIEDKLAEYEAQLRATLRIQGCGRRAIEDPPADSDAPWRQVSVEEVIADRRRDLEEWKAEALRTVRRLVSDPTFASRQRQHGVH